ncbi:ATP-binding protein [Nocardiopsis sp. CC223A]|uniref:ATP-binding protein n=1 Tax=Nocardiopsis sp. CC223A TaxID=3044051 RepID=UPI00278C3637|nr:ATP-binding protein [Nocardiopsis sp. CC223A]
MPETVHDPRLHPVPVAGAAFVRPGHRHYFTGTCERAPYRLRRYAFPGLGEVMPLVRAFLDTCAAHRDADYRYLFTLLGSELAANAVRHSLSGRPGGHYTLLVHRNRHGLHLTCRDLGAATGEDTCLSPGRLPAEAETGRGLALVDALATDWGDNGYARCRTVWCYLAYDLQGSRWRELALMA